MDEATQALYAQVKALSEKVKELEFSNRSYRRELLRLLGGDEETQDSKAVMNDLIGDVTL